MIKKKHKSNAAFLKDLFKHLEGDVKGFKKEIKEDKSLMKKIKSRKVTPAKAREHLNEDMEYYGHEIQEDKKLRKRSLKQDKKKRGLDLLIDLQKAKKNGKKKSGMAKKSRKKS